MFYLIIIFASIILIAAGNLILAIPVIPSDIWWSLWVTALAAAAVFALDAISALVIRRLTPKEWYMPNNSLFKVSKKERNFYRALKIKEWKDMVPELGGFTDFHKDKLENPNDPAYLERFIIEANYGVVIHLANAVLGVFIVFIPICSSLTVWVPVFLVNLVLSLLPVAILRYTSYTLQNLYDRCKRREAARGGKESL